MAPTVSSSCGVLDVAPSGHMTSLLQRLAPARYVRVDLDPSADRRTVDVQASVTQLPFADASFDLVICYHVLEHVPDDGAGMRELARVLRHGGVVLAQVPWRSDVVTDEDPSASDDERIRRFGQADHVRWYGTDFDDRLRAAGLQPFRFLPTDVLTASACDLMRLNPNEPVWVLHRTDATRPPDLANGDPARRPDLANRTVDALLREVVAARGEAERYRAAYQRLRTLPPIRAAAALVKPFRR
jgi:SAM-dependent methyltransferase